MSPAQGSVPLPAVDDTQADQDITAQEDKFNHNEDDEDEPEDTTPKITKIHPSEIVNEKPYSPYAYVAFFNGYTYGIPDSVNFRFGTAFLSPSTRLTFDGLEASLWPSLSSAASSSATIP